MARTIGLLMAILASFPVTVGRAQVTNRFRKSVHSNNYQWNNFNNWSSSVVPNSGNDALIDREGASLTDASGEVRDLSLSGNSSTEVSLFLAGEAASLRSRNAYIGLNGGDPLTSVFVHGGRWRSEQALAVGHQGDGLLDIQDVPGGFNQVSANLAIIGNYANVSGTVNIKVGRLVGNELRVGNAGIGRLNIASGGAVYSDLGVIGYEASGQGEVNVSGVDSKWINSYDLIVGHASTQTDWLVIANGGTVTSGNGVIGNLPGSSGRAMILNKDAKWNTNSQLVVVGNQGIGRLALSNGGAVSNGIGIIGSQPSSFGAAILVVGSTWNNKEALIVGRQSTRTSRLDIESSSVVTSASGIIGEFPGSSGIVWLSGTGSKWDSGRELRVGSAGIGQLRILDGARVDSTNAYIGYDSSAFGSVSVGSSLPSVVGSTWEGGGQLVVGDHGRGHLSVDFRSTVKFPKVLVQSNGTINGYGKIVGSVTNNGVVSPKVKIERASALNIQGVDVFSASLRADGAAGEGLSPSALVISGDYMQGPTGSLHLEISSAESFDQLDVGGHVSLDGALKLSLLHGFIPQAGQLFDFLRYGSLSGRFAHYDLPTLTGGLRWDTRHIHDKGVLTVIPAPEPASIILLALFLATHFRRGPLHSSHFTRVGNTAPPSSTLLIRSPLPRRPQSSSIWRQSP